MQNTGTTANKLLAYDGSGNLPAVDSSQLINVATGITNSASDPTISTNPSGGVGTQWNNTTSGEIYICTDATAGSNVWTNVGPGSGDVEPATWNGSRGVSAGGTASPGNIIEYVTIATIGNAVDFGDLYFSRRQSGSCSNGVRGVFAGGLQFNPSFAYTNVIDYITIATPGNSTDFGDLWGGNNYEIEGCSNGVRGIFGGGQRSPGGAQNVIDYLTIATTGNTIDFGDLTAARQVGGACSNGPRGIFAGGDGSPISNIIEYVTIATIGNATDFGDRLDTTKLGGACSNTTRGIFAGGSGDTNFKNVIEYITIATPGNSTDFGDLTVGRESGAMSSNGARGIFAGGYSPVTTTIDYITIATTGNAIDFGDLTVATYSNSCVAGT